MTEPKRIIKPLTDEEISDLVGIPVKDLDITKEEFPEFWALESASRLSVLRQVRDILMKPWTTDAILKELESEIAELEKEAKK